MQKIEGIIFDMDGCLYPFDRGSGKTFAGSEFGQSIKRQEVLFTQGRLGIALTEAAAINEGLKQRYNRHLSIGLEREYGIPRADFFGATWNLEPRDYIDEHPTLSRTLGSLSVRIGLLTAAPEVWAQRVLRHLGVSEYFDGNIVCGDQDVRKPDPRAFLQIADLLGIEPENLVSIGDQDHTDILPAKSLGMYTVRIGDSSLAANLVARDVPDALNKLTTEGLL